LYFRIEDIFSKDLKEGKQKLEHLLPKFLAKLEIEAIRRRNSRLKHEEDARKREAEEELLRLRKKQIEDERAIVINLINLARRIERSNYVRKYILAKELRLNSEDKLTKEVKKWRHIVPFLVLIANAGTADPI